MVRKVEVEYEIEDEIESEDEVEKNIDIDSVFDLDILIGFYLSNRTLVKTIIENKDNQIKDIEHLKNRLSEFKTSLIEQGRLNESFREFAKYFRSWNKTVPTVKKKSNDPIKNIAF